MKEADRTAVRMKRIAVAGNPNSGKTTLFNSLTGMRQKVANYPGVTVEKVEGSLRYDNGRQAILIDLPGSYSLFPNSPDEKVAVDFLRGKSGEGRPDLVLCVVDCTNLVRNLYLVTQLIDLRIPVVLALNMSDVAERAGNPVDAQKLSSELGIPVVATVATDGTGLGELKRILARNEHQPPLPGAWKLPEIVERELRELTGLLEEHQGMDHHDAMYEAVHLLSSNNGLTEGSNALQPNVLEHIRRDREKLDFMEIDRQSVFVEARYARIRELCRKAQTGVRGSRPSLTEKIDRIVLHRFWGYLIFFVLMGMMFQSIFAWATVPMDWIASLFDATGRLVSETIPPGDVRDLLVNGALGGVSAVVMFLPQILFLFFFLGLLEETGYMARAAFLMDHVMNRVGLHGKSFIPLLSSFACAIPGIMATRTLENSKDRLATMLVAPLMSCSARLPVYTLLIAAFVPGLLLFGFLSLPALVLLSLYILGLVAALFFAWVFRKTFLKGDTSSFVLELPPYRRPSLRSILIQMWERGRIFLQTAGTFILAVSVVLWFLASYPRSEGASPAEQLRESFAGQAGQLIEPVIKPLGFDWKIGIGLVGSVLQREVFVSTMGTIYNIQDSGKTDGSISLRNKLRNEVDPVTGKPSFTLLTALCLMVYYAFAMQCLSTVAIMRRETNGWKWPLFQIGYMSALAYAATFVTYHVGLQMGLGG